MTVKLEVNLTKSGNVGNITKYKCTVETSKKNVRKAMTQTETQGTRDIKSNQQIYLQSKRADKISVHSLLNGGKLVMDSAEKVEVEVLIPFLSTVM